MRDAAYNYCEKNAFLRNVTGTHVAKGIRTWQNASVTDRYEVINTLSSLSFFIPIIFLMTLYFKKLNALAFFFGVYQIAHALGTFTNHFCGCQPGYMWDNASVWSMLAYMLTVNVLALLPKTRCHPKQNTNAKTRHQCRAFMVVSNLCLTALCVGLTFLKLSTLAQGILQGILFVALVVLGSVIVATRNVAKRARGMFIASVVVLSIGVAFALMDTPVCLTSKIGFHVGWHIGGGFAMTFYTDFLMDVMTKIES
jgi:heme O synthase-like polyprenyltransferase